MRVLFVLRPMAGGMKEVTAQYLSLAQTAGVAVAAVGPASALPEQVPGHALEAFPFGRATRQLTEVAGAFKPDLLHAHGLMAGVTSLGVGVPLVYTLHGFPPPGPAGGLFRILENRVMAQAAVLSATSAALAKDAAWRSRRTVHALPVATRLPSAPRIAPPARPGPVIGVLGRLSPEKGWDVLLAAFRLFRRRHPEARLLIGGLGPLWSALNEAIAAVDLVSSVELLGWVEPQTFYAQLDLYTQPSRQEGLGLAAREAVAFGLPVVASRVGGLVEACGEGPWARYVPVGVASALADAWSETLALDQAEISSKARAWAKGIGGPAVVEQALSGLYRVALAAPSADIGSSRFGQQE